MSKIKKLKEKIKTMDMDELLKLRDEIQVSDASIKKKSEVMQAIRLRTHPSDAAMVENSEYDIGHEE